jgi:biotin operon repressor
LVQAGHSQRAVARVLGISHTSVWRVVHAAEAM